MSANWAEKDLRTMASECGCEDLYKEDFQMWSAGTHNMWHHLHPFSLEACRNPLHRGGHRVPCAAKWFGQDLGYAERAAFYLDDAFEAFDSFRGICPVLQPSSDWFESELAALGDKIADNADPESASSAAPPESKNENDTN